MLTDHRLLAGALGLAAMVVLMLIGSFVAPGGFAHATRTFETPARASAN